MKQREPVEVRTAWLVAWAVAAAFSAYFCMYAFRKPFAAGAYPGEVFGIQLKIALVVSQVIGYALSKFIGIRLVSETSRARRAVTLVALIGMAELALIAFGLLPPAGQVVAIFFNGLPLGAVWGLVFGFLEGRKTTELLGAGLSASYIVASGAVKSIGRMLLDAGVPEVWMPALTGALFVAPFLLAVWALNRLPPPSAEDVAARVEREPMDGKHRREFFRRFAPGLIALVILHVFVTAYRDFRDNFQAEIFAELGQVDASVFARSEGLVALTVLILLAGIFVIRDNRRALLVLHGLMIAGLLLIAVSTLMMRAGWIGGMTWMVLDGIGLYLAYVPYGTVLFDRLIAATGVIATSVFMIYVADAFGYVGSIVVVLVKNFSGVELSWLDFFVGFSWVVVAIGVAGFVFSGTYFANVTRDRARSVPR